MKSRLPVRSGIRAGFGDGSAPNPAQFTTKVDSEKVELVEEEDFGDELEFCG